MMALEGLRVLDLSRVLAGPYATMILADLGADVIKIEVPGGGDDSRNFGPYLHGESAYFMSLNRNKRSVTLNLKSPRGRQVFRELVPLMDVLVENFRPGTLEKLELGYETLRDLNPRLIYAAVSGFGRTGPYSQRPAYDGVVQAMSGVMSITGQEDGKPTRVGTSIGDIVAGIFTAVGILSALAARERTGQGQLVDVAMLDCQVAILENAIARYSVTGEIPRPIGNRHPSVVPIEPFETLDGQLMIAAGNDAVWGRLCEALERPDLAVDPRFKTNPLRHAHYTELRPILAEIFQKRTNADWQARLDAAGIPASPINNVAQVMAHPQVLAREMLVRLEHPVAGELTMAGIPIKLSETPGAMRTPAPTLGQHTESVLREWLGYTAEQIAELRAEGAL
ncbi:MAG TPA: CoA transferase [Anaerolineae bacterium]|mgnify:CR=1 FL=1|nr:CoA transferase [Anaerolineae bacterium]HQH38067.1 CoA transferase [Anaerolineae bacterium]